MPKAPSFRIRLIEDIAASPVPEKALSPASQRGLATSMAEQYNSLNYRAVQGEISGLRLVPRIIFGMAGGAVAMPALFVLAGVGADLSGIGVLAGLGSIGGIMAGMGLGEAANFFDVRKKARSELADFVIRCYDMLLEGHFPDITAQYQLSGILGAARNGYGIVSAAAAYEILDSGQVTNTGLEVVLAGMMDAEKAEALLTAKRIKSPEAKELLSKAVAGTIRDPRDARDYLAHIEDGQ